MSGPLWFLPLFLSRRGFGFLFCFYLCLLLWIFGEFCCSQCDCDIWSTCRLWGVFSLVFSEFPGPVVLCLSFLLKQWLPLLQQTFPQLLCFLYLPGIITDMLEFWKKIPIVPENLVLPFWSSCVGGAWTISVADTPGHVSDSQCWWARQVPCSSLIQWCLGL